MNFVEKLIANLPISAGNSNDYKVLCNIVKPVLLINPAFRIIKNI